MLKNTTEWNGFRRIFNQTKAKYGKKRENIRHLIYIIFEFNKSMQEHFVIDKKTNPDCLNSLAFWCYSELVRISTHTFFLMDFGLYRNAFDNIRYVLESIVQALYIDNRHPQTDIKTKIEILKEVENKTEYHAIRLIDELKIENKDKLKQEYKALSQSIHPSHKQIVATLTDMKQGDGIPARIDPQEIDRIYNSMKTMYDIFFFLYIDHIPNSKELLRKNPAFLQYVQNYRLNLISQAIGLKLKKPD